MNFPISQSISQDPLSSKLYLKYKLLGIAALQSTNIFGLGPLASLDTSSGMLMLVCIVST